VADGARLVNPAGRRSAAGCVPALGALLLAIAPFAPSQAGPGTTGAAGGTAGEQQDYSYYYVPRLSELNRLVGHIFRSGLVSTDAADPATAITRYAAYSCEGTLYAGRDAHARAVEDIDWSAVTALHTGPVAGPPSLIIERVRPARGSVTPLVLYFSDATTRYQLHQALAVLVSECRPRDPHGDDAPRPST